MARLEEKQKALDLRKKGMSYSQIKSALNVGKSTLSGWLKDYPLSKERIRELRDCNEQRIEKCRETKRVKKEARLTDFCKQEKKKIFPLNKQELYLAGLFLYWGEGAKTQQSKLTVSNTDPAVIKFFVYWLEKSLAVSKKRLRFQLHLYRDMNIDKEIDFWAKKLRVSKNQFNKPYIKSSFSDKINHKGAFGHGTCNVALGDARLSERVLMALKAVGDYFVK
jgi:hypothetical protein